MTRSEVAAPSAWTPPFASDVLAAARRLARWHPILLATVAAVVAGGGAGGAVLSRSNGFRPAAACPRASSYVYEVPSYPAHAPTAPAWPPGGNDNWGWMPGRHALQVGDRLRVNGAPWRVAAIATLPGECSYFGVPGPPGALGGGSLAGRLIRRPAG